MKIAHVELAFALCAVLVTTGCSRLDHLGREPSFTTVSREPSMPPRNPTLEYGSRAPIMDRSYPHAMQRASYQEPHAVLASHSAPMAGSTNGSLWSSDPKSLFGDRRAKKVGDILTVVIEIDDEAQLSNTTSRQRSGDESAQATALFGFETLVNKVLPGGGLDPGASVTSSSTASGQGQVSRNEAISLKIAARVMEILPTGHLLITGRQEVRVNFELRDLQVVGLIRPEDITRNNDITYDKMAEARISYGGRGHISDVQQARYGQQILDMISPF